MGRVFCRRNHHGWKGLYPRGQALQLNEDGTGYAATFYFDDATEDPIEVRGGKSIVPFTYTTDWDGNISLTFNNDYQEDADYYATWGFNWSSCVSDMLNGTAATGKFYYAKEAKSNWESKSCVPSGWTWQEAE